MSTDDDLSHIAGNASREAKALVASPIRFFTLASGKHFGDSIGARLVVTEVSIDKKSEEPEKNEGRVVCELMVQEDMLNGGGKIHGGCSAFLIDLCSTLALSAYILETTGSRMSNVSQALNVVYHSPAELDDKLRIVNTTMTVGGRAMSARTEIWNVTHHRLVASGVHIKMQPSPAKPKL